MKNKDKIIELINKQGSIKTPEITSKLEISRQYAFMVISDLIAKKQLIKIGGTRNAFYATSKYIKEHPEVLPKEFRKKYKNKNLEEHKVLLEIEEKLPAFSNLPENVKSILTFAFSEMLNNAIEHSGSKIISVEVTFEEDKKLSFTVTDSGIGVFRNIMKKRGLHSETEAIQDLLKGKTTTMPQSHSGEGIFFTSRAAELFILESFNYELLIQHLIDHKKEVEFREVKSKKRGTWVHFVISLNSKLHLNDVFKKYANLTSESNYGFDKTEIEVKLFTAGGVNISRSQARRILFGLDKFKIIMLDFDKVPLVGQAFADEIYRVFPNAHPDITIQEKNMSEGVKFMVERAKNEAKKG